MKNAFFLIFTLVILLNAFQQKVHYTQQSTEIDTYKKSIQAYEKQGWTALALHYADTAKILNNVKDKDTHTVAQFITQNKEEATLFSSWKYDPESVEYEMVVTDKGETSVNLLGHWEANLKAYGKYYVIPAHITTRFIDSEIVREDGLLGYL